MKFVVGNGDSIVCWRALTRKSAPSVYVQNLSVNKKVRINNFYEMCGDCAFKRGGSPP